MPTFTDLTQPTKSNPTGAGLDWTPTGAEGPAAGVLTVTTRRGSCTYVVCSIYDKPDGRAFLLSKLDVGTDKRERSYIAFVGTPGRGRSRCSCRGFKYRRRCRHLDALVTLIGNGWA